MLGKPLAVDVITAQDEKLGFASMYVIVNLNQELKSELNVRILGKIYKIKVDYLNLPDKCALCNQLGHAGPACNLFSAEALEAPPEPEATDKIRTRGRSVRRRGPNRSRRNKKSFSQANCSPQRVLLRVDHSSEPLRTDAMTLPNEEEIPKASSRLNRRSLSRNRSAEGRVWIRKQHRGEDAGTSKNASMMNTESLNMVVDRVVQDDEVLKTLKHCLLKQLGEWTKDRGEEEDLNVDVQGHGGMVGKATGTSLNPA